MAKIYQVPFDPEAGMIRYYRYGDIYRGGRRGHLIEKPSSEIFASTMELVDVGYSNHSAFFILRGSDGLRYFLNAEDIKKFVEQAVNGRVSGFWKFKKKGPAYSIKLVDAIQEDE